MKETGKHDPFSRDKRSMEINPEMIQMLQLDNDFSF